MIRVMSYNIRANCKADDAQGLGWKARRDKVLSVIRHHAPDIFGVQEALQIQIQNLRQGLPEYEYYGLGRDDGRSGGEYTALFFRKGAYRRLSAATHWLSETPQQPSVGWDASAPCTATQLRLQVCESGLQLCVWNTCFDLRGEASRRNSALWLHSQIHACPDPVVMLADLNALPGDECYNLLTEDGYLADAWEVSEAEPEGPESTYRGFRGIPRRGARMNFVFASPHWRVLAYEVPQDLYEEPPLPSDHFPVLAELAYDPDAALETDLEGQLAPEDQNF